MPLLECKNLSLGYNKKILVKDLNFSVNAGDYLCIIGENGSGKSTLMRTILGLQKAIEGQIILSDGLQKNQIGYLPQQTQVQRDFPASVFEIVISGCQASAGFRPFYNKEEKQRAFKNMKRLGILPLAKKCYRELSGGQQQRVLLARALCATQKMILLDEPITGLDPNAAEEMYRLVKDLNKNDGISVIMISHDVNVALKDATHILNIGAKISFEERR
ncbi:MAG: metal ABC transporter ATP-binding protein [Treponema sp.]|nr:metal ABC transporter ATP-binding protein [Treponema sp.]